MKNVLDTLYVLLLIGFIVSATLFVGFCVVGNVTGDGLTDWEQDMAIRLCVTMLGFLFAGRIVDLLRGRDRR